MDEDKQEENLERYFATLLFVANSTEPDYQPLYEENFILVSAANEEQAIKLAKDYGLAAAHEYKSVDGYDIEWHYQETISVTLCIEDDFSKPVVELHGRFLRDIESFNKLRSVD